MPRVLALALAVALAVALCASAGASLSSPSAPSPSPPSSSSPPLFYSYVWHLQQPIYWPDTQQLNTTSSHPTYQRAWDSIQLRAQQDGHPQNDVASIFALDDRVAIYQGRATDALGTVTGAFPSFGVQITYPGDLIDNVASLGANNAYGYSGSALNAYASATQSARTPAGFPRLDIVWFTYHHAFGPLIDRAMLAKELGIHAVQYAKTWGAGVPLSKGMFPTEMAFSERMIPTLVQAGIEWVVVPNNHLSRAVANYAFSPSGDNCDPPNNADLLNPAQANWFARSVNRGCEPNNAVPFAYTPHYAVHTDPDTGKEYRIVVVPSAMAMSWEDSESCYDTGDMDQIAAHSTDPNHPPLIVLAHDGDNAFSGGYSYYMQCVSQLANDAAGKGYGELGISEYLSRYPVDPNDVVHVEDGAWINHDGDFGDPQFIWGWLGILRNQTGAYDIENGWDCNSRSWAIITASQNYVETAEQMAGGVDIKEVQLPSSQATPAEVAWHFHLVEPSGWMYYGCPNLDMADKPSISANHATHFAKLAISQAAARNGATDQTPPSIFAVQRFPYNPGGYGAGAKWKFQLTQMQRDFYVFSYVFDVSGVKSAAVMFRTDGDGVVDASNRVRVPRATGLPDVRPAPGHAFGTDAAGGWTSAPMTMRAFPKGDMWNVHFDVLPDYIADLYYAHFTQFNNVLVDYYVQATDALGNVKQSDIFHVYVGTSKH